MVGTYSFGLVLLSIAVAFLASYIAVDLASRVAASKSGTAARYWLVGGALTMGTGIWSMHFIGMLALHLPLEISYDIPITLVSLFTAIIVSGFALHVISLSVLSLSRLLIAGTLMGIGIAAMHYTGMWAMQLRPSIRYDLTLFCLSIIIAVAASIAALWIAFRLRSKSAVSASWLRAGGALLMGLAVAGMHYTGMAAAMFAPDSVCTVGSQDINTTWLAGTIGLSVFAMVAMTFVILFFHARLADRAAKHAQALHSINMALALANAQLQEEVRERAVAHLALRESQTQLRSAFDCAPIGMALVAPDGSWIQVNQAICDSVGYSEQELLALTFQDLTHPDDLATDLDYVAQVLSGDLATYQMEKRYFHKRGHVVWVLLSVSLVRAEDGTPVHFISQIQDISARKKTEHALRGSEARLRSLLELSSDWYWEQDEQYRYTSRGGVALTEVGFLSDAYIGKTRWELPHVGMTEQAWDEHRAALDARESFRDMELSRINQSGEQRHISVSGEPVFDAEGRFIGYCGVARDISRQKRAELDLIRRKDLYAALSHTNRAIIHLREPQALFTEVCRVAVEYGHFCLAWIGLLDEKSGWVEPMALRVPADRTYAGNIRISADPNVPEGQGFASACLREGQHYVVNDFFADERTGPWRAQALAAGVKSLATFPLKQGGRCVGLLNLHGDEVGFFTDELIGLLDEMAMNLSFALDTMQEATQRKTAELALRNSEERFRSLVELSSDWYWEQDAQCRFTFLSRQATTKSGLAGARNIGQTRWDRPGLDPSSANWRAHRAACEAHRPFRDFTYQRIGEDAGARWISVSGEPVFDADHQFKGYRGIGKDVTERVITEQRIVRLNALYKSLSATNEIIARAEDQDQLLREVCRTAVEHGGFSMAWVGMRTPVSGSVIPAACYGEHCDDYLKGISVSDDETIPAGQGMIGGAIRARAVDVSNDLLDDVRQGPWHARATLAGFRACAAVPLLLDAEVIGVLALYASQLGYFDEEMVDMLVRMGGNLSYALQNLQRDQQRRQAQQALIESAQRFRSLVDLSSDWYWEQDEQFRFTAMSIYADARSGIPAARSLGHNRWDHPGVDLSSANWAQHRADYESRRPFQHFTYRRIGDDGIARWISVSGEPIFDSDGQFKGYRGVGQDVTKRIVSEQRILRLSAFYQALSATNEAVIQTKDRDRLLQKVCRIVVEHGGMSLAWIGLHDRANSRVVLLTSHGGDQHYDQEYSVSSGESLPEGRGPMSIAVRSGQIQIANDLLNDERLAPWQERLEHTGFRSKAVVPVFEGREINLVMQLYSHEVDFFDAEIVTLITRMSEGLSYALENQTREHEREQAIAALAQSEERFQLVAQGTNDGIFDWDMISGATYFSPRFKELLGYEESEFAHRRESFEAHLHPDDRETMATALRDHLEHRTPHQSEYRLRTKSGEWRWFQSRGQATWDAEGRPIRFTGVSRDVTDRKSAERKLERLKDLYAALSATNQAIVHVREPQEFFESICRISVEHGHFRNAWISLLDSATGRIEPVAASGVSLQQLRAIRQTIDPALPEGRGYLAQSLQERRHIVINDYMADERVRFWWDIAQDFGFRSAGIFPLFEDGEPGGVLILGGREVGFFTDQLVSLVVKMTEDISFALGNFRREAERRIVAAALKDSEEKFRQLAAHIPEVFWITELSYERVSYVSPAYETIWGRNAQQLLTDASDWMQAIHAVDRERVEATFRSAPAGRFDHEYRIVRPDGTVRWIHDRSFPIENKANNVLSIARISEDITTRKESEGQLLRLAHYDSLTELPNRVLFYDRLQQSLVHSRRAGHATGVMFVDLDHFKLVNDSLGHASGDELLRQVAQRIVGTLRPGDTVGRLGGDEFAVVMSDLAHADDAARVAAKLMAALEQPFDLNGHEVFVTASAGVTLFPVDGEELDALVQNADAAMYRAKELGRSNYQFYRAEMKERSLGRLSIETDLRRALERNEFVLHYQPKVNLKLGHVTGVEALLRWNHPEFGMVPPAQFISSLEENGQIGPVGEWVLAEATRQIKAWKKAGLGWIPVAVNVSGRQLQQSDLDRRFIEIVNQQEIEPGLIELEITESVLMRNADHAIRILHGLKALGFRLSMDDFGTGYSSLSNLKSFPLDTLKIDRSLICDITRNLDDALIARTVISMAQGLRLNVVAEGVETKDQLEALRASGCDEMQGYLFSKPLQADDLSLLLREGRTLLNSAPEARTKPETRRGIGTVPSEDSPSIGT